MPAQVRRGTVTDEEPEAEPAPVQRAVVGFQLASDAEHTAQAPSSASASSTQESRRRSTFMGNLRSSMRRRSSVRPSSNDGETSTSRRSRASASFSRLGGSRASVSFKGRSSKRVAPASDAPQPPQLDPELVRRKEEGKQEENVNMDEDKDEYNHGDNNSIGWQQDMKHAHLPHATDTRE